MLEVLLSVAKPARMEASAAGASLPNEKADHEMASNLQAKPPTY